MKNKKGLALLTSLLILGFLPAAGGQKSKDQVGYRDTVVVSPEETRDNVVTFGGNIIVEGKVRKSVLAVGGTITVSGEVGDSVVGIGARISLKSTAVVKGDLVGLGGTLEKEPGFRVDGDTVYFKGSDISSKIVKEGVKGILSFSLLPIILIFKLINIFIWFLLVLLVASLLPKQVTLASDQVRKSFWPTFAAGLVAIILFTFCVIVSAFLCLLLIGIPILLALMLAGLVIKIFGKVALFYFFGESLSRAFHGQKVSPLGAAMLGLLFLSLIGFIPILGFLVSFVLSILGWGVAIRTKFGTTENWFKRPAQPQ
jgi:hypothetical protein